MDVSEDYIAGLIDGHRPVKLGITTSDSFRTGFRIRPNLIFNTHTNYTRGFLDELFRDQGLRYYEVEQSNDLLKFSVSSRSGILDFLSNYEDKLIGTKPIYDYVKDYLEADQENGKLKDKDRFVRHVATIQELFPLRARGSQIKYTTDYFENKWDVNEQEPFDIEEPTPRELSDEYVAGLLDGCGRITMRISEKDMQAVGYSFSTCAEFSMPDMSEALRSSLCEYLDDRDITYTVSDTGNSTSISIQRLDSVESLIENVGIHLVRHYHTAEVFYSEVIPRVREGNHTTKRGFYDIVNIAEAAIAESGRRRDGDGRVKYTASFFGELWGYSDSVEHSLATPIGA